MFKWRHRFVTRFFRCREPLSREHVAFVLTGALTNPIEPHHPRPLQSENSHRRRPSDKIPYKLCILNGHSGHHIVEIEISTLYRYLGMVAGYSMGPRMEWHT